ncbi:MAG: hypothetical protein OWQ56_01575, partial [Acidithiobacillus caldus]|nr:hypothetical protein [Acidithiobacillus caldus]
HPGHLRYEGRSYRPYAPMSLLKRITRLSFALPKADFQRPGFLQLAHRIRAYREAIAHKRWDRLQDALDSFLVFACFGLLLTGTVSLERRLFSNLQRFDALLIP